MLAAMTRDTPDRTPWWPKGTIWGLPGSPQIQPAGNAMLLNAMKVDVISHASTARTLVARFYIFYSTCVLRPFLAQSSKLYPSSLAVARGKKICADTLQALVHPYKLTTVRLGS
jgi:hypothetical protein